MKLEFYQQFFENTQIPNFKKIRLVAAELFHAYGRTDMTMTKLTVTFPNFANATKNYVSNFPDDIIFFPVECCIVKEAFSV